MNEIIEMFSAGVGIGSTWYAPATIAGDVTQQCSENKLQQTAAKTLQSFNAAGIATMGTVLAMDALDISYRVISPIGMFMYMSMLSIPAVTCALEKMCPDQAEKFAKFDKQYGLFLKIANIAAAVFGIVLGVMVADFFTFPIIIVINAAVLLSSGYALAKELTPLFSRQQSCP